jgi:hypothetical protein
MTVRPLFNKGDLSSQLRANEQLAVEAVRDVAPDTVLATPEADLVDQLYEKFSAEPLQLHPEAKWSPTGVAATKIGIRSGPFQDPFEGFGPSHVDGIRVEMAVPFDGQELLFDLRPSQWSTMFPRAEIRGGDVILVHEGRNPANAETITADFDRQLALLMGYAQSSASECRAYNERLRPALVGAVAAQRKKILADREVEAALNIPVRRRPDQDLALNLTVLKRRREVPVVSRQSTKGFVPEPAISAEAFADIIGAIRSMGLATERLPDTFGPMQEPALRDLLLVVLNNQFGPSGGEMFSRKGRTDVAIWHETGAVFIAECKFWSGEKGFGQAIDQLLGYLVWRDTKAALVLFIREKGVSGIQEKARKRLQAHPRFKRQAAHVSGCPVFILHHEGDRNKEIEIALVVVAVPPAKDKAS